MKFNIINKNNLGIIATFILVILLSQSRFFNFLIDTHLGRIAMLAFVIFVAYTNKFLGLAAVLFIIIAFNQNNYSYFEGFDVSGNPVLNKKKQEIQTDVTNVQTNLNNAESNLQTLQTNLANLKQTISTDISNNQVDLSTTTSSESFSGREGFCMTDRESNIVRGKSSNSVPIFDNLRKQSDDIYPSEKSVFTSSFASF